MKRIYEKLNDHDSKYPGSIHKFMAAKSMQNEWKIQIELIEMRKGEKNHVEITNCGFLTC